MIDVTQYADVIETAIRQKKVRAKDREDMIQECYLALLEKQDELEKDPESASKICQKRIDSIFRVEGQYDIKEGHRVQFVSSDIPAIAHLLYKIGAEEGGLISESELYEAIETLGPEDKPIIKAIYIEGLTMTAAAEKLKISIWTALRRKKRGIMELKRIFGVSDGN